MWVLIGRVYVWWWRIIDCISQRETLGGGDTYLESRRYVLHTYVRRPTWLLPLVHVVDGRVLKRVGDLWVVGATQVNC
jgi:hypothetical protein